jgi:DNA repair protein RadC
MSVRSEILALLKERPEDVARVLRLLRPSATSVVTCASDAVAVVSPLLLGRETEALVAVALDRRRRVVACEVLTEGSAGFTIVHSGA